MKRTFYITGAILFLFTVMLTWVSLEKFRLGLYNGLDLAIFNQVFWQTTHGHFLGMTIHPHSYLGDHFELFILLLAPFYALVPRPETLLVLQAIAAASAPIPLIILAAKKSAGALSDFLVVLLTALWTLNPFVHNAFFFEFHIYIFAAPILAWTYYFYRLRNLKWFWIFFLALLSVREDVALTAFMFPVLALIEGIANKRGRKGIVKWCLPQAVIATLWFVMSTQISSWINPGGGYKFFEFYSWMGNDVSEILWFITSNPIQTIQHVFSSNTLSVLGIFFAGTAFLSFFAPVTLLLGLPTLLVNTLVNPGMTSIFLVSHYSIILTMVLFISAFEAIPRIAKTIQKLCSYKSIQALLCVTLSLIAMSWVGNVIGSSPFLAWKDRASFPMLRVPQNNPSERQALEAQLAEYDRVMVSAEYLADFGDRDQLMSLHYTYIGKQQFSDKDFDLPKIDAALFNSNEIIRLIVSKDLFDWATEGINNGSKRLREYLEMNGLKPAETFDDTILFLREGELEPFTLEPVRVTVTSAEISSARLYDCNESICLDVTSLHESGGEDVMIKLEISSGNESVWQSYYLPAYGLYMPHEFDSAQKIKTTWRLALPKLSKGDYSVSLSLHPIEGLQSISQIRNIAFIPAEDLETLDEYELDFITCDERCVVSADQ